MQSPMYSKQYFSLMANISTKMSASTQLHLKNKKKTYFNEKTLYLSDFYMKYKSFS